MNTHGRLVDSRLYLPVGRVLCPHRVDVDTQASDVSQAFQDFATNAHQHYAMTPAVGSPSANVVAGGSVYRTITRGGSRVSTRGSGVGLASSGGTLSSTAPPAPPATGGSPRANRTGSLGGRGRGCDGGSASSVVPELPQRGSTTRVGAPSGDSNCSISEPGEIMSMCIQCQRTGVSCPSVVFFVCGSCAA